MPLKVYNEVAFNIFTELCPLPRYLISERIHHPRKKPLMPRSCHSRFPHLPETLMTSNLLPVLILDVLL